MKRNNKNKFGRVAMETRSQYIARVIIYIFLGFLSFITIWPVLHILAKSFSSAGFIEAGKVGIVPKGFTLDAYREAMNFKMFWRSYANTILYTAVGTSVNMIMTIAMAFCLSRKELIGRKYFSVLAVTTMFISGGLVPSFLLVKNLGLYNTIWALVLPGAISTYNLIVMRTSFMAVPEELIEATQMDGGGYLTILYKVVLPLSKPVLATITLFYGLGHWNQYFNATIYLKDRELMPLQVILKDLVVSNQVSQVSAEASSMLNEMSNLSSQGLTAATVILALIPIMLIYPFIQKYFVKGIMVGSLKG